MGIAGADGAQRPEASLEDRTPAEFAAGKLKPRVALTWESGHWRNRVTTDYRCFGGKFERIPCTASFKSPEAASMLMVPSADPRQTNAFFSVL